MNEVKKRAEKLQGMGKKPCPVCTRPITDDVLKSAVTTLEAQVTEHRKNIDVVGMQISTKTQELEALPVPPPLEPSDVHDMAAAYVNELRSRGDELTRRLAETKRTIDTCSPLLRNRAETLTRINAKIAEQRVKLEKAKKELDELEDENAALEFWVMGFGPSGIRSFMIETELPEINRLATRYATRLLGPGVEICLSPTTTLKTKSQKREKMSVSGTITGLARSYANASRGQKKRFDLAVLLALREVVARRSGATAQQLFVDEVFDGLDAEGVDAVTEILKEMSETCPVALITHDERLRGAGDRVISVLLRGDGASILSFATDNGVIDEGGPDERRRSQGNGKRKSSGPDAVGVVVRKGQRKMQRV